mgnify:CR=1 FL=1
MADQSEREPWLVYEMPHDDVADYEVRTPSDYIVASVHNRQHADIIAAVGDLYESCQALVAALHPSASPADRGDAEEQARDALAKADGREGGEHE